MKEIECKSRKNEVVKNNDLIKAKGELSSTAQKLLAMVISMINSTDSEFQEYALQIESYCDAVGTSSNNTEHIKKQAEELMSNPFVVDGMMFNWCSMVDLKRIEGYIIFDIHSKLKPYLLGLQGNFTKYQLTNVLKLKGTYSVSLYEYLVMRFRTYRNEYFKQHNKYPKSFTFDISIDWLRATYKVPDSYRYDNIKTQIINKAQADFKEHTDIRFTYQEQKIGRKVDRLVIKVKENTKGSNDYLYDIQSFTKYMRKHYINQDILQATDTKNNGKPMLLSVSADGLMYDKYSSNNIEPKRAKVLWEKLYEMALDDTLLCLKQGELNFDED
jgi:plasmid replication initiation protein